METQTSLYSSRARARAACDGVSVKLSSGHSGSHQQRTATCSLQAKPSPLPASVNKTLLALDHNHSCTRGSAAVAELSRRAYHVDSQALAQESLLTPGLKRGLSSRCAGPCMLIRCLSSLCPSLSVSLWHVFLFLHLSTCRLGSIRKVPSHEGMGGFLAHGRSCSSILNGHLDSWSPCGQRCSAMVRDRCHRPLEPTHSCSPAALS